MAFKDRVRLFAMVDGCDELRTIVPTSDEDSQGAARYAHEDIAGGSRTISAYDKATGAHLDSLDLPAVPGGNPVTYWHDGRQYLVVAVGTGEDAELLALTLP
jgi:hypothetical protein